MIKFLILVDRMYCYNEYYRFGYYVGLVIGMFAGISITYEVMK